MKFLIQTINNQIKHDFSFTLMESIEYQNWINISNNYLYELIDYKDINEHNKSQYKDYIPIGSVDFVHKILNEYYNLEPPKPLNIPSELLTVEFTGRKIINGTEKDIQGKKFVKSNDKLKSFIELTDVAPVGNYQISDIVEFESEYRCFVYQNKLVGLQQYCSDFTIFPNIEQINKMINAYKSAPIAYTLDVGLIKNNSRQLFDTVIIEVHNFYSVGLYGMANHKLLPFMFQRWFVEYLEKNLIK